MAALTAAGGVPPPGSPTSRCRTSAPLAARALAAAIISITMNGAMALRREGLNGGWSLMLC